MFRDRIDAGARLAEALSDYAGDPAAVVLGIPRGGVIVAAVVAKALGLPLDVALASKIGAPGNPEFAVGAVDEDGAITAGSGVPVSAEYLELQAVTRLAELSRRASVYREGRPAIDVAALTAIIVDDGIATGLTVRAAVALVRGRGASRIVVAAPVMPPDTRTALERLADEVVALEMPWDFSAVGRWYRDFAQTSDAEVIAALRGAR